jgi:hypothetical protein
MQVLLVSHIFCQMSLYKPHVLQYLASPMFCDMELGKMRGDPNDHTLYCHDR